jgi:23S rRNA (uracil-5-)-methyltransferase RumA
MIEFSTMLKCEYFPLCSGCEIQGDVSLPPIWQGLKIFFNRVALDLFIPLKVKEVTKWRCRSKLAVRGVSTAPQIGLFKKGSHEVVSIPNCPLHHPAINAVNSQVRQAMIEHKIDPYDEEKGSGMLRYLQFVVERKTKLVQLTLVVNRMNKDPQLEKFVKRLYNQGGLHSIWLNFQPMQTNTIFGEQWSLIEGESCVWERLGNVDCAFHPACFGQAHLSLYDEVLNKICEWVEPNQQVLELYAGIGAIGFNLASKSENVLCVEINPYAAECFQMSRLQLLPEIQGKVAMQISTSAEAITKLNEKQVIIVDPPRKGLESEVLEAICSSKSLKQMIYLSCGPISFQRDCEKLISRGWSIDAIEGYLFFPGCDHVEILCSLRK